VFSRLRCEATPAAAAARSTREAFAVAPRLKRLLLLLLRLPADIIAAERQCGGRGGNCSTLGTCTDAAWPGKTCTTNYTCYR
jgi:hypothetical protein